MGRKRANKFRSKPAGAESGPPPPPTPPPPPRAAAPDSDDSEVDAEEVFEHLRRQAEAAEARRRAAEASAPPDEGVFAALVAFVRRLLHSVFGFPAADDSGADTAKQGPHPPPPPPQPAVPAAPACPYELLGLVKGAPGLDAAAVGRAYKMRALVAHPDKGGSAVAFQQLAAARDAVLKDLRHGAPRDDSSDDDEARAAEEAESAREDAARARRAAAQQAARDEAEAARLRREAGPARKRGGDPVERWQADLAHAYAKHARVKGPFVREYPGQSRAEAVRLCILRPAFTRHAFIIASSLLLHSFLIADVCPQARAAAAAEVGPCPVPLHVLVASTHPLCVAIRAKAHGSLCTYLRMCEMKRQVESSGESDARATFLRQCLAQFDILADVGGGNNVLHAAAFFGDAKAAALVCALAGDDALQELALKTNRGGATPAQLARGGVRRRRRRRRKRRRRGGGRAGGAIGGS